MTTTHPLATSICYRYQAWAHDYDEEEVWAFVQRHGGYISVRQDCIDFFIPVQYRCLFELAYPDLSRQPGLDLI